MKNIFTFLIIFVFIFMVGCTVENNEIKYTVTFYDENGNVLKEEQVKEGESANAPIVNKEGYIFIGWDEDITSVTKDMEVMPIFEEQEFNVVFKDDEGNIIDEVKTKYGKRAIDPKPPVKVGYNFVGWDKDFKSVKEDMEITTIYELATYKITYIVDGQEVNLQPSTYTVLDNASIELPALIEKEGYECLGWYEGDTRVVTFFSSDAEDKEYTLKYEKLPEPLAIPSDSTFLFPNIKKTPHSSGNGTFVYQPDFAGLNVETGASNWTWTSLNPNVATISMYSSIFSVSPGYAIIRAENIKDSSIVGYAVIKVTADGVFISSVEEANTKVEYEVTFTDENGKIITTQKVEQNKSAVLPTPPIKEGYTFVGWSGKHYNIEENMTFEPTYVKGTSDFVGKTVSILGDSISTFKGYNPSGYSTFYPYATADFSDVNQTWWMQVINDLGMTLLKNNSWGGSCVSEGTGSSATCTDERLKELLYGTQTPDIIIIFMGNNDCASANVSLSNFDSSYKLMLEKIKILCPNSKIYIMTMPKSMLYTEKNQIDYNKVIRKYTEEFKHTLLEIENMYGNEDVKNYLIDSAHPNLAGMNKFADEVKKLLLESAGIK